MMSGNKDLIGCFILIAVTCSGREIPDNQGKEFIIGFMDAGEAYSGTSSSRPLELFITTASTVPVTVSVSAPNATNLYHGDQFTVSKGTFRQLSIPQTLRSRGTERSRKAIHIVSSQEIVVFGLNQAEYSTDGFLGIPLDVLGTRYFVPSYVSTSETFYQSEILIVGTEDGSILNIKLPSTKGISIRLEGKRYIGGDWINTTLNKFETLQLRCHGDLTGTFVLASKKVSVFGGTSVTSIGDGTTRDHIEEQIPPVNVWGKLFAVSQFPDTNSNFLRFLASEDNTEISINNKETVHLKAGGFHETKFNHFAFISSNKPILTAHYVPSGTCNMFSFFVKDGCHKSDPAMALTPPIEQSNIVYSFLTPVSSQHLNFSNIFMFVIEQTYEDGILLDNKPLPKNKLKNLVHRYNLTAGYIRIPPGSHTIEHSSKIVPFGGILYGGIQFESYAFPVGQRFSTITKECRPQVMEIGDGVDNDCDGRVDEEICNDFKDNDGDGQSDEDCLQTTTVNTITQTVMTVKPTAKTGISTSRAMSSTTAQKTKTAASTSRATSTTTAQKTKTAASTSKAMSTTTAQKTKTAASTSRTIATTTAQKTKTAASTSKPMSTTTAQKTKTAVSTSRAMSTTTAQKTKTAVSTSRAMSTTTAQKTKTAVSTSRAMSTTTAQKTKTAASTSKPMSTTTAQETKTAVSTSRAMSTTTAQKTKTAVSTSRAMSTTTAQKTKTAVSTSRAMSTMKAQKTKTAASTSGAMSTTTAQKTKTAVSTSKAMSTTTAQKTKTAVSTSRAMSTTTAQKTKTAASTSKAMSTRTAQKTKTASSTSRAMSTSAAQKTTTAASTSGAMSTTTAQKTKTAASTSRAMATSAAQTTIVTIKHHADSDPERPNWLTYTEYGLVACVSLVAIGVLVVCCEKCWGFIAKRNDDDDEEEKYRRNLYRKARKAFGPPRVRPLHM